MTLPLFEMTDARRRELVERFGMTAAPSRQYKRCSGVCCWRGKKATGAGHGPYRFVGTAYVGSERKFEELWPEIQEARRLTLAQQSAHPGAQKEARRGVKPRRAGGTRCGHTEHQTA